MNFIEKIMSIGKPMENTETATEQPEPKAQSDTSDMATNQPIETTAAADAEPRTYTDDEISQLLESKKLEWQEEMNTKNEAYINSLPEAERLKIQQLTKDEEIANLKGEIIRRDLEKTVISKLEEMEIPTGLAQLVHYSDEPQTMESLNKVIDIFDTALANAIKLRLKGRTPAGLGGAANCENSSIVDPFAKAFSNSFNR